MSLNHRQVGWWYRLCISTCTTENWERSMRSHHLVGLVLAMIAPHAYGVPIIFDLAADWSDTQNPNGAWTYTGNSGALLGTNQTDWDPTPTIFGSPQKAWADAAFADAAHVPMWFQRTSDSTQLDIALGAWACTVPKVLRSHGSASLGPAAATALRTSWEASGKR